MPSDLFELFKSALSRRRLWTAPEPVLVAVSGGADSTALLLLFLRLREEASFPLSLAHLNHSLRGEESDADEAFVREIARKHGVPAHVERLPPGTLSGASEGLEAAARKARYDFLRRVARSTGAARVALAHTRDDQAETFLMRLLRGAATRGLGGIHPKLDDRFIRPLLDIPRGAILEYLRGEGAPWREDSSNQDLARLRNRVRHRLLPWLRSEFHPTVDESLARTAEVLRDEDDYLSWVTADLGHRLIRSEEQGLCLAIPAVKEIPIALQRRLLRLFLERAGASTAARPDYATTSALGTLVEEGRHGASVTLSPEIEIRVSYAYLVAVRKEAASAGEPIPLPVPGEAALPDLGVRLSARHATPAEVGDPRGNLSHACALLDADRLPGALAVRRRRNGDHFRPLGAPGESKLKSYFIDQKVPQVVRDRIPLVIAGDQIAWVVGFQIDDRFKVTPHTRRVLVLSKELP